MFESFIQNKQAFIFGFDNVIYPEKDYLLQVYYLFSEFIEYSEQLRAKEILAFMQHEFNTVGAQHIFDKTAAKFNIPQKYADNFNLLHENARLPLKLLIYQQVLSLLQEIVVKKKQIFFLIEGNPAMQINKIKQIEWNGLEQYLKLYFVDEFEDKSISNTITHIINENMLAKNDILFIINDLSSEKQIDELSLDCLEVTKIL